MTMEKKTTYVGRVQTLRKQVEDLEYIVRDLVVQVETLTQAMEIEVGMRDKMEKFIEEAFKTLLARKPSKEEKALMMDEMMYPLTNLPQIVGEYPPTYHPEMTD